MAENTRLIEALAAAETLPGAALAEAIGAPESIAPATLRALESAAAGGEPSPEEGNLLFWGLHVLAHARDTRALPPLLRLLREDEDTLDALFGDAIGETLPKVIASLYDEDPAPLFALLLDSTVDDGVRMSVFSACTFLTQEGRIARDAIHALLIRFDEAQAAVEQALAWTGWEETIALLGFRDLAPRVEAARRDGRINDEFSDAPWFKETLRKAEAKPRDQERFDPRAHGYLDDPIAALAWTAEGAGRPVVNPFKNVGRNDPCPCGSGKKFKKCCLDKAA